MKKILLLLTLMYIPMANCCEKDISENIEKSLDNLCFILFEYEINGAKYSQNFDYEIGHLHGQRVAYMNILKILESSDSCR